MSAEKGGETEGRMKRQILVRLVATVVLGVGLALADAPWARSATVSCIPTVQGPIPITATSQPFVPVAAEGPLPLPAGYVQQEFFVSCTALGQPYETRIFLRRPVNPAKFSGTVVLEVADGPLWTIIYQSASNQTAAGHVSVVLDSVPSFLNAFVKPFNPSRYAALNIPNVTGISYEIEAQVGALLKSNLPSGPLPDLHVRHVIFAGYSGSALEVRNYITNEVLNLDARMPDGSPIYDGFYPQEAAVQAPLAPIPDLDVPVVEIQGEREVERYLQLFGAGSLTYRRPDSDVYRLYEVPGQPHLGTRVGELAPFYANWKCDYPGASFPYNSYPAGSFLTSDSSVATQFPHAFIDDMGLRNLVDWVTKGIVPPHADPIEVEGTTVVRDDFGNALGGVRSSYLDVPIATYMAISTNDPATPPGSRCDMIGFQIKFSAAELKDLYGNHGGYVSAVNGRLNQLVKERWILKRDANQLRVEAAHANIP